MKHKWGPVMRMKLLLACAATALLGACAAPQQITDEYRNVPRTNFAYADRDYRIFDKPSAGKLIITPSVASAMGTSLLRNVTFGAMGTKSPKGALQQAVEAYLVTNGRKCTVSDAKQLKRPQWEFDYTCEIKYTATDSAPQPGAGFSAVAIESK